MKTVIQMVPGGDTTHKPTTNHPQQIVMGLLEDGEKSIIELMVHVVIKTETVSVNLCLIT